MEVGLKCLVSAMEQCAVTAIMSPSCIRQVQAGPHSYMVVCTGPHRHSLLDNIISLYHQLHHTVQNGGVKTLHRIPLLYELRDVKADKMGGVRCGLLVVDAETNIGGSLRRVECHKIKRQLEWMVRTVEQVTTEMGTSTFQLLFDL